MYYKDAAAAILVYDITKPETFKGLQRWINEIQEKGPKNCILAIAGNKEDLVEREQVQVADALKLADSVGASFKKTSAKTNIGINALFEDLSQRLRKIEKRQTIKINQLPQQKPNNKPVQSCCK